MALWHAVLLGVLQGLTEFLPVSSSGHLVLARAVLGVATPGASLEAALHGGTLLAVLWAYRADLRTLAEGACRPGPAGGGARAALLALAVATLPAAIVAVVARHALEAMFARPVTAAWGEVATTLLLASLAFAGPGRARRPTALQALGVGIAQALALVPGLSRSGATLAAGRWLGLEARESVRFAFWLSAPASLGAVIVEAPALARVGIDGPAWAVAVAVAAGVGVFAIRAVERLVAHNRLWGFALYTGAVAVLSLALLPGGPWG
jgi:undecaprenyl-diphosphatase